ncbi:MAG: class I SAM-dependent methyltransferase [Chitinispirillales bacterium]|jgi:SAM-dependent methyltransferase|nr:class I SAM-dependent methyltransferase [Chitinispirillales bacterium]
MQYDVIAPMYDRLMRHVDYGEWIDLIARVIKRFSASDDPEILEIGAGTGVVGGRLGGLGYRYTASDLSFPMCREAHNERNLPICAADARALPFKKQFGLALFLYDGINYLHTQGDYRKLFASVCDILLPGGLFLFDITTRANSVKHFTNYFDYDDYGDFSYARHSYFDDKKSIQHNDFTIYRQSPENPGLYEKHTETHTQKVFSVSEIEKTIPRKRFTVLGIWDGYSFRKFSPRSERIHFLLRKTL